MFLVWVGGGEARHSYCCGNAQITGLYSVSPRPCQKHWYLQRFAPLYNIPAQGCGTRRVVTSVQSLGQPLQEVQGLTKVSSVVCAKTPPQGFSTGSLKRCTVGSKVLGPSAACVVLSILRFPRVLAT